MILKRLLTRSCILPLVLFCSKLPAQELPSTLLWRISGKGIASPSYLYGSMHIRDRRIFFLGDSLYTALDQCAGLAIELNPDDLLNSFLNKKQKDSSPLLKHFISPADFETLKPLIRRELRVDPETITWLQFREARDSALYHLHKPDDMSAPLDLYLYDIARRKGKWVGGIEDLNDQLSLLDDPAYKMDVKAVSQIFDEAYRRRKVEEMITVYLRQDLTAIQHMSLADKEDFIFNRRNVKMCRRIDSLANIRPSFFVTGAAHLPGDSGLIQLLRIRGFTLEPVFSSKKIDPADYRFEEADTWVTVSDSDSTYRVSLPAQPSEFQLPVAGMQGKYCFELGKNRAFFIAALHNYVPDTSNLMENIRMAMEKKNQVVLSKKAYASDGFTGVEMLTVQADFFYRMIILQVNQSIFLLMSACPDSTQLYDRDMEKFIASFHPTGRKAVLPSRPWVQYEDSLRAFRSVFPGQPAVNALSGVEDTEDFSNYSLSSLDSTGSMYYIVYVSETRPGYLITSDSLIFQAKIDYYKEQGYAVDELRYFSWHGFPAMEFRSAGVKNDVTVITQLKLIIRQNRSYTVAAITTDKLAGHPAVGLFFDSFQLLPYRHSGWSHQTPACGRFSTWSPSSIRLPPADSSTTVWDDTARCRERVCTYEAFDSSSATTINVTIAPASRYFWTENDSTYFAALCSEYYTDTASEEARSAPGQFDSLISLTPVSSGSSRGYELFVKNGSRKYYKRVRLFRSGNHACQVYALGSLEYLNSTQVDRFFRDFRILDTAATCTLFTRKVPLILEDMRSDDSTVRAAAASAFSDARFLAEDVPVLRQAFEQAPDTVSDGQPSVASRITYALEELDTAAVRSLAGALYPVLPDGSARKMLLLQLLASNRNKASARLLTDCMLHAPPRTGTPYRLFSWLGDSLDICRESVPLLSGLYPDSLLGPGLIYLTLKLIDSNRLGSDYLQQHAGKIHAAAETRLRTLKSGVTDYLLYSDDLVRALDLLGDKESLRLLRAFRQLDLPELKLQATVALLRNRQHLPPAEIRQLAALPAYRLGLYEELKKEGLLRFFPRDMQHQNSFAESYIVQHAAGADEVEMEDTRFRLLGEKTAVVNGRRQRFFIYRVHFTYGEGQSTCIAVCGGFGPDRRSLLLPDDQYAVGIYYEDPLPADLNAIFRRFTDDYLTAKEN